MDYKKTSCGRTYLSGTAGLLLNVLYAQSPANGGGKLYLGHVDNEDFISDLQLSNPAASCQRTSPVGDQQQCLSCIGSLQRMEQFLFMKGI